ncbi:FAD-dependent monooxygenase [Marinobacterium marinum]|uniref:FAD-dependent monooxygenase n=1 Tax=Marinobacterium marinum TaxID=2756129 RepID=A0A7W1WZ42_9GAMM|nr:FAD-dependent monooxygenase [Marinobacterium marinum]MBA4502761.1 FAD-dependent monooxygenase [Marinobacterium marinum]
MCDPYRIAIVGAGVAGMALAILASRQGYKVSLYERGTEVSSIGAGVTLWPNAMWVMRQMGLEQAVRQEGGAPRFMRQFDSQGRQQGEFDIKAVNALSGFPSITILRRDLMRLLAGRLSKLGVEIRFGQNVSLECIDRLKQTHDLVVGADGRMNSVVRQALYGDRVHPVYQGFINIIGISRREESGIEPAIHEYRGAGERFGIVPVHAGLCYWAGAWAAPVDRERPLADWYRELRQRFMHWPDPVRQVLASHESASLNRIFVHDLDPLPYWHRDNVLILGDAAHAPLPTSGQGACQALEDAWHLVRLLAEQQETARVLQMFYQQRISKTTMAQAIGRRIAESLFSQPGEVRAVMPSPSAEQLNELWMQGLGGGSATD